MTISSALRATFAAACVTCVTAACDVPVLPQWDTDWNLPLPSQAIPLAPVPIPNNTTIAATMPTQTQDLDASIGELLKNASDTGAVVITITKPAGLALSGADTLFIASSAAGLDNPGAASRIEVAFAFAATDGTKSDTLPVLNLGIVRTAADNGGTLYLRFRGTITNNSGGVVTPAATDSIAVKLALLATIHSSTKD